jgi:putative flippase GtrA
MVAEKVPVHLLAFVRLNSVPPVTADTSSVISHKPGTLLMKSPLLALSASEFVDSETVSLADAVISHIPQPFRGLAVRHREFIKFAIVGGTTFVFDASIFYTLKLTVLEEKPVTAKIIAGVMAVILSYILNREWSFKNRGGRERHHEAFLFFLVSGIGVVLAFMPLYISSYVFDLRYPNVSRTSENIADFISAYIIGNLLQMVFRFWSMKKWVFPDENARGAAAGSTDFEPTPEDLYEEELGHS